MDGVGVVAGEGGQANVARKVSTSPTPAMASCLHSSRTTPRRKFEVCHDGTHGSACREGNELHPRQYATLRLVLLTRVKFVLQTLLSAACGA